MARTKTNDKKQKGKIVILRNAVRCNLCGDVIESEYTHDFKMCSCGSVGVDGGKMYLRRCFKNSPEDLTDLSETKYETNNGLEDENG